MIFLIAVRIFSYRLEHILWSLTRGFTRFEQKLRLKELSFNKQLPNLYNVYNLWLADKTLTNYIISYELYNIISSWLYNVNRRSDSIADTFWPKIIIKSNKMARFLEFLLYINSTIPTFKVKYIYKKKVQS